jgi:hypothetical protein
MLLFSRWSCAWAALFFFASLGLSAQQPTHSAPMLERFGKPYVMVTVNGKGPYRFVIDTGTGADAFVSPELADELHLPGDGEAQLSDPSKQSPQRVPMVLLQSIQIAGVEFPQVRAIRHSVTGEAGTCSGLLGFTLFRDYLLTLDFPGRSVSLTQGSLPPDGERSVLPFREPEGVPIATLRLGGRPVEAQFDSGGGGLTLPEPLAAHLKWEIAPVVFATGNTLTTRFSIKAAKLAFDVKVGKFTFHRPVVEIHPAFPLVNFGSPPMQNFAITFDQKNRLLRLAADREHFYLTAPPTPTRLSNQPHPEPAPRGLTPLS